MATTSKQQAAINAAQDLVALMSQFIELRKATKAFVDRYNSEGYSTTWSNMPTVASNTDGTLGLIDQTAGSGTVSVTASSTAITFSASQTALAGKYLVVTGDSTNGIYLIVAGATTAWTLATAYAGGTAATASWGTATPNTAHPILSGAISRSQAALVNGVTLLNQFVNFCTNVAVVTGNYSQSMDDLAS